MSAEAAELLAGHRKVKGIGVDALGLDRAKKGTEQTFGAHYAVLGAFIAIIV